MEKRFLEEFTPEGEARGALEARAKSCLDGNHGFGARVRRGDAILRLRFRHLPPSQALLCLGHAPLPLVNAASKHALMSGSHRMKRKKTPCGAC